MEADRLLDTRLRPTGDGRASVATIAAAEPLAALPAPFLAVLAVARIASAQALVALPEIPIRVRFSLTGGSTSWYPGFSARPGRAGRPSGKARRS